MNADDTVRLLAYADDPLLHLTDLVLTRHGNELPDLTAHVVLLARADALPRWRDTLIARARQRGIEALLPPTSTTLDRWARGFCASDRRVLRHSEREAKLHRALQDFPGIMARFGTWPLIDSLLLLFDELHRQHYQPPAELAEFRSVLAEGYGAATTLGPLADEAALVHSLWRAWREQLAAHQQLDETLAVHDGLERSLAMLRPHGHVYVAGFATFTPAQVAWMDALRARRQITVLLQGRAQSHPQEPGYVLATLAPLALGAGGNVASPSGYARFLDEAFSHAAPLRERAQTQTAHAPSSPCSGRLHLYAAPDAETEARAIDLQVRRWRLAGWHDIGIITQDRKLARRVRALLERADIALSDSGGWALSTTSAATALHDWIATLETDFSYLPLLDLLRSPFVRIASDPLAFRDTVLAFEQHVVIGRTVPSGLDRFRGAIAGSGLRAEDQEAVGAMLAALHRAATPLTPLLRTPGCSAGQLFDALEASLALLGIWDRYAQDEAGNTILDTLAELRASLTIAAAPLDWHTFSTWLRRALERRRYRPPRRGRGVELISLADSVLYRFDALIIAAATREHLPGLPGRTPFFNDGVRARLGLRRARDQRALALHDFRRLLEAAPRVLITRQRERDGEILAASPWVARLEAFHTLAYGDDLFDHELGALLHHPATELSVPAPPLPTRIRGARAPAVPALAQAPWTAGDHQALIDCPYQFYCGAMLGLRRAQPMRETLEPAEYGKRVHRILQAFHAGLAGTPGPWHGALTPATLPAARALLMAISEAVFARDLQHSRLAGAWRQRWLAQIDRYLDWAARRSERWTSVATELAQTRELRDANGALVLAGRIDRLDRSSAGLGIVDYKTGALPDRETLRSGENCQLLHYALLVDEPVEQVALLGLHPDGLRDQVHIDGQALAELTHAVGRRALRLKGALDAGASLPAWGDSESCARCEMSGVCRKEYWCATPMDR